MRYNKIFIGVLNSKNIEKLQELQQVSNTVNVLLSNINISELSLNDRNLISKNDKFIFIPNQKDIAKLREYKKLKDHTLFVDFVLKQPIELKLTLSNYSLLYISSKNKVWHEEYDGKLGFGISCSNNKESNFYNHSVILPNDKDQLLLKMFDGYLLQDTNKNPC
jgi:hypothetical protein